MVDGGKVIIKIDGDTKGFEKSAGDLRSQAAKLAAEFRKQGMSQSEAMKKAWSEIDRTSSDKSGKVKDDINSIGDKAKKTSREISSSFDGAFKKIKDVAGTTAKAVGVGLAASAAAITTGLGAAVKVGSDFEAQMSTVGAISGASAENMKLLGAKAKEMGIKTQFSATEAGQAMEYMAMAGWKTEDMLNGVEGIMNLAAASGENLAATSDIVTDAMTAFGLSADQSTRFADVLAAASSNANTNVGMMGETFKYVAPVAGTMGFSIEDTAVAIGLMANAGIKGSQAGTALRSTLSRLAKPPKEAADAMDALNLSVTNSDGSFKGFGQIISEIRDKFGNLTAEQKTSYAAMIGGQEAMSGLLAIVNASDEDFNKLTDAINQSSGSAEKMANVRLDNFQGQITLLKSSLEGLGVAIFEGNNNILTGAVEQAKEYVNQMTEAFNNGGFSGLIEQVGAIFADIATKIAEQTPTIIESAKNLIITFINALSENDDIIAEAAIDILASLTNAVMELIPQIISLGGSIFQALLDGMNEKFGGITTLIEMIGIAFASIKIGTTIQSIVTGFQSAQLSLALFTASTNGASIAQAALNGTLTVGETIVALLTGKMTMAQLAQAGMAKAQALLNAVMSANPIALVIAGITALVAAFVLLWNKSETFRNFWINLWEGIKSAVSAAVNFVKNNWEQVKLFLINPIAGAIALLYKLNPKFKEWVDNLIAQVKAWFSNMTEVGKHIITGIWNGITSAKDWLLKKVKGLVDSVKNVFTNKKGLDEHSPSKWSESVFEYLIEGAVRGLEENKTDLLNAAAEIVEDTKTEVQKVMDEMNKELLDSEKKYNAESERLKESKSEADKAYLESLKETAGKERKLYDALQKDIENSKKNIISTFKDIAEKAYNTVDDVIKAQQSLESKLKDFGSLTTEQTIEIMNGKEIKATRLSDLEYQTKQLKEYENMLLAVKKRGNVPKEFFDEIRDMSIDDGLKFSKLLISASNEEFNKFITDWKEKQDTAARISKELYADEAELASKQILDNFTDVPEEFFNIGEESMKQFGEGFMSKVGELLKAFKEHISADMGAMFVDGALAYAGSSNSYTDNSSLTVIAGSQSEHSIIEAYNQNKVYNKHVRGW